MDGRKHWEELWKDEAAPPPVMVDSVLIAAAIEASENWDVAVIDLPGAYLHADMDDLIIIVMRGQLVELMAEIVPEIYWNYVMNHNGKAIVYVILQKALHGFLKSALLFYQILVGDLKRVGFELKLAWVNN